MVTVAADRLVLIKVSSLLMVVSGSVSLGMNVAEGKPMSRLLLNLVVLVCGFILNFLKIRERK